MINYYTVLEVVNFASNEDIKVAYRRLSKRWHPDVNGGSEYHAEKFKEIQAAYDCLSRPGRREIYDYDLNGFLNGYYSESSSHHTSYQSYKPQTTPVYQNEKSPRWFSARMLFRFAYLTFFAFRVYTCNDRDSSYDFYRVNGATPVIVTYEKKKTAAEILDSFARSSQQTDTLVRHAEAPDGNVVQPVQ